MSLQLELIKPITQEDVVKYDETKNGWLKIGDVAPNCFVEPLHEEYEIENIKMRRNPKLQKITPKRILEYSTGDKPLVLNFGSYSWGPFTILQSTAFESLYNSYNDRVDFLTIYIKEAHPTDGWKLFKYVDIKNHKNMIDRQLAAYKYINYTKTECNVVCDQMYSNPINKQYNCQDSYSAWPARLYIILNKKIVYKQPAGAYNYKPNDVKLWLQNYFKKPSIITSKL